MKYEISKATALAMPNHGKGTECVKLLLLLTSKGMNFPFIPMLFPLLAHTLVVRNFSIPTSFGRKHAA